MIKIVSERLKEKRIYDRILKISIFILKRTILISLILKEYIFFIFLYFSNKDIYINFYDYIIRIFSSFSYNTLVFHFQSFIYNNNL